MNKELKQEAKTLTRREMIEKSIKESVDSNGEIEMPSIRKFYQAEVKKFEDGSYRFIATKEIRDSDDEVVEISGGDFKRYLKNPVWIWGHRMMFGDAYDVIGRAEDLRVETSESGEKQLTFNPVYARHQKAQDIKAMHEDGIATAISIGFKVKEYDFERKVITSWELFEISNVIVPANEDAIAYATEKGILNEQEVQDFIKAKVQKINKKKLSEYRSLFLGKDLLSLIGYTKTGNELVDVKNVYNLILENLHKPNSMIENQSIEPSISQQNEVKGVTVGEAQEYLKEKLSGLFAKPINK